MILDLRDNHTGSAYYTNAKATYSGCYISVAKLVTLSLSEQEILKISKEICVAYVTKCFVDQGV